MPEPTTRDVLHALRRQIRRVRWRRNLYELQRALYLLVAIEAGAATAIVLLAVGSGEAAFAAASWVIAAAAVLLAGWIALATARSWLGSVQAPSWIDRRAGLKGRLATLVELGACNEPFLPLLATQNARLLPTWKPERMLPDTFPPAALVAALLASVALLATMVLAPRLGPPSPPPSAHARALGSSLRLGRDADRMALAEEEQEEADADRSALMRLPGELQDHIRRRMWGRRWQAVLDARAHAARARAGDEQPRAPAEGAEFERSWEIARTSLSRRTAAEGAAAAGVGPQGAQGERRAAQAAPPVRGDGQAGVHGQAAAGAGTATDPNLLGQASTPQPGRSTFELPLAARVRSQGGGPRPPSGEAPPAALDERPDLAARQRRDAPVLRIDVPPTYEAIVRRMFAHGSGDVAP